MSSTRYRIFQGMLLVWAAILVALFAVVQAASSWGSKEASLDHLWQVWHPYWYGIMNSSIVIIPAVTGCMWTARGYGWLRSHVGRAILFLAAGCSMWGVGNLLWFHANACNVMPGPLHCSKTIEIVYPGWPDLGYLSILPFSAAALLSLSRALGTPLRDYARLLWVPVIPGAITWLVLFRLFDAYVLPHSTRAERLTSATYITSDVVLLSLSIMMLILARRAAGGTFFPPMLGISLGMVMLYVGDMLFFPRVFFSDKAHAAKLPDSGVLHFLFRGYYNGDVSDLMYGISMLLCTIGIFLFARSEQQQLAKLREFEAAMMAQAAVGDSPALGAGGVG